MKNKWWILLLFTFGCQSSKVEEEIDLPPPPPLPTHFLIPNAPPNFIPDIREIQINSVPHPFRISGTYVVWVNKKKLNLNKHQVDQLVKHLDLSMEIPKNTAQIHSGEGWLFPFDIDE
jgi:hypothetical protein